MKYLILVMLMVSCKTGTTVELPVGTCYYEGGDIGGTPSILHCVQAKGSDGFLRCQGSDILSRGWRWYACRESSEFKWLIKAVVVKCPLPCPDLSKP